MTAAREPSSSGAADVTIASHRDIRIEADKTAEVVGGGAGTVLAESCGNRASIAGFAMSMS